MDNKNIDFTPLDPGNDKNRFEKIVKSLAARIISARQTTVTSELYRLFMPAFVGTMIIFIICSTLFFSFEIRKPETLSKPDKTVTFAKWVNNDQIDSVWNQIETLRGQ
jgi:hypothetical protein